MNLLRRPWYW